MDYRILNLFPGVVSLWHSRIRAIVLGLLLVLGLSASANAQTAPPVLFFTDLDSGPNSGGESLGGVAGAYVTLYGNFLGASQGSSTVTWNGLNCLRVVPATGSYTGWGSTYFWYQKIVVQLGPSCAPGAGNFVVNVGGAPSNGIPFTVRTAGHIYFSATTGNDSSGSGSSTSPFRSVVGCKNHEAAGDICYIENGVSDTGTDNFDATINIDRAGTSGNPIAIVAYPGATAGIHAGTGTTYGVRVANVGVAQSYWTIAGLSIEADNGGGQAMNPTQNSTQWRVVGNLFQCPNASGQDGCFTTNEVTFLYFYGNETTNTGTTAASKQQHANYFSSDTNHVNVGWNYIHNNRSCRAIQFHSSPLGGGGSGDPTGHQQFDLSVHDNLIHDDPCDGINLATVDPSQGKVEIYNNVIYHVGLGPDPSDGEASYNCLYFPQILNTGPAGSGTVEIYNNTFYDCGSHVGSFNLSGTISVSSGPLSFHFRNNIGFQLPGEFYNNSGAAPGATVTGSNNIWFGSSQSAPSFTTGNITLNPQLSAPASANFHLLTASPAVDAGVTISSANTFGGYQVWNGSPLDHDGVTRPQGSAYDIGAYEYFAGGSNVQRPNPPTNLTVIVK